MGKAKITIYRVNQSWHPYPWRFKIEHDGTTHQFIGLQNQCETRELAQIKAGFRALWLEDGSFHERYDLILNASWNRRKSNEIQTQ